jgi:hypothetical protein
MNNQLTSDTAPIDIAQRCSKKNYSAPSLRDLDGIDTTEGGTQLNHIESLNGTLSS